AYGLALFFSTPKLWKESISSTPLKFSGSVYPPSRPDPCVQSGVGDSVCPHRVCCFTRSQHTVLLGGIMAISALVTLFAPQISFPPDFNTNFLMLVRWIHFVAGITSI